MSEPVVFAGLDLGKEYLLSATEGGGRWVAVEIDRDGHTITAYRPGVLGEPVERPAVRPMPDQAYAPRHPLNRAEEVSDK